MADRRTQLLEAFKEHEEDETEDGVVVADDHDEPVLAAETDDKVLADDGAGKESSGKDEGTVSVGSEKSAAGSDLAKPAKRKAPAKVPAKADAPKGTKEDASKPTLEQTENDAAIGEAPKSWKVATREQWKDIPAAAREEIQRRETEITQFIGQHGKAIQHKQQFDEIVQPYLPFIAAQQSTPLKAFHGLMNTAARLTTGAPQQKAMVVAEIMRNYGVDAQTLDAVLSAQMQGKQLPNNEQPPAWAQPLFSFVQETRQAKLQREQQVQQEAAAEIAEFEKKPFFNELREDVGLLMARATSRNQVLSLEAAYTQARKMNPEIDAILTQREKAALQKNGNGGDPIARARRAAATVRGAPSTTVAAQPNGVVKSEKPMDRRSALRAAIDSLQED